MGFLTFERFLVNLTVESLQEESLVIKSFVNDLIVEIDFSIKITKKV